MLKYATNFLDRCVELKDATWQGLGPVSLILSVRPPTYADVARRFLASLETRKAPTRIGAEIDRCVDALRGTRYRRRFKRVIRVRRDGDAVSLTLGSPTAPERIRLVLASLPVAPSEFKGAAQSVPSLTFKRLDTLDAALRDARTAVREGKKRGLSSLLVMPELSIPRRWMVAVREFADQEGIALVTGVEYEPRGGAVVNEATGIFPLPWHTTAVVTWTKRHPARGEAALLRKLKVQFQSPSPAHTRLIVESEFGRFGVLICSEILEASALSELSGRVDTLLVPAWNDDTWSFDHLAHAAASALVHAFVGVANNAEASDSRVVAPIKEPRYERDWSRLIQRNESRVVWADLPIAELRAFHDTQGIDEGTPEEDGDQRPRPRVYRPLPPDWLRPASRSGRRRK